MKCFAILGLLLAVDVHGAGGPVVYRGARLGMPRCRGFLEFWASRAPVR